MSSSLTTSPSCHTAANPDQSIPQLKNDWTKSEVANIYNTRLLNLIFQAASVHRLFHNPEDVQQCTLLSIKTGACPEDCSYCPQSARYDTPVKAEGLLNIGAVVTAAQIAKDAGSTRFCMGAAWREIKDNEAFEQVLEMVKEVNDLGLEVCCTLGMLDLPQAQRLKQAGLTAYNHNLDTGAEYYNQIITTRTYQDRLNYTQTCSRCWHYCLLWWHYWHG